MNHTLIYTQLPGRYYFKRLSTEEFTKCCTKSLTKNSDWISSTRMTLNETNLNLDEATFGKGDTIVGVVKALIEKKESIEHEMDEIAQTLNSETFLNIGLQKPLVDEDGFPIAGIDLLAVRQSRNKFAVLKTDLEHVLSNIESHIEEIHAHARTTGSVNPGQRGTFVPFGRVESVASGSSADAAGILAGDQILKFGPLSTVTTSGVSHCYNSIPTVVSQLAQGQSISVTIKRLGRESEGIETTINPAGGRVGCLIKPL